MRVDGLPEGCTKVDLLGYFGRFGGVSLVSLLGEGVAVVKFVGRRGAEGAMGAGEVRIGGRLVRVSWFQDIARRGRGVGGGKVEVCGISYFLNLFFIYLFIFYLFLFIDLFIYLFFLNFFSFFFRLPLSKLLKLSKTLKKIWTKTWMKKEKVQRESALGRDKNKILKLKMKKKNRQCWRGEIELSKP